MNEVYIGYSNDCDIRYRSSSGGIITATIKSLFESNYIGTFLGCYFDTSDCCYKPKMIHSFAEYDLVGSVYQDMDIVGFLKKNISDVKGRLMVVCSPCLVKVVRHIAKKHSVDVFVVSYFCSGQTTIEGTYFYYKALGIDKTNVKNIRYRGKGWPNGIEIQLKDGTVIKHPNYTEPWKTLHRSRLFTPRRCFLCKQVESVDADISVGDPWLKEYLSEDKIGNSLFLVHTELGLNVINRMLSNHSITCNHVDYNLYLKSQKPSVIRKSNIKEDKDFIDFELNIQNKSRFYKWATKNFSNMQKHVWIMEHLVRPYFNAKKMNKKMIVIKLINKVIRKLNSGGARWYWRNKLGALGNNWNKGEDVTIQNPQCIFFGDNVGIGEHSYFMPCISYACIEYHPKITIGDGTWIGIRNSFAAIHGITIGKNVLFAGYVHVTDHSHGYEDINLPIAKQPLISKGPVVIEDNCWLGFNSEILSGVHIGRNSVVAAHAVVTKNVPPYSIIAGNPARIVKQYNFETHEWERYK